MKNKTITILLTIFLGGFGGHYFYLERITSGILSLLFCWTLIPSFVAFINLIQFITMSDEKFNQKYNHAKN
ncbi:MAG: TM2 domain-containing protein [Candidatus Peribacteraceae bacterium]|nr:TM2 domain-containing protein [Candidatus Peribacteraceae bacterium]